jgi:hypothetical protein
VVVNALPFQLILELETKPEPVTVSVKLAPPALALCGASDEIAGTGLGEIGGGTIPAPELPPPHEPIMKEMKTVAIVMSLTL